MHKALQHYVTRYLAVWEIDITQPPIAASKASQNPAGAKSHKHQQRITAARQKADFFFSRLPLASLKSGCHPAPGSCLWIYAFIVNQIAENTDFKPQADYEKYYGELNSRQQESEREAFVIALKSIPERTIEQLIQTGPAPFWVAKPLFPSPANTRITKETCSPAKIWRLNSLQLYASKIDRANVQHSAPIPNIAT